MAAGFAAVAAGAGGAGALFRNLLLGAALAVTVRDCVGAEATAH